MSNEMKKDDVMMNMKGLDIPKIGDTPEPNGMDAPIDAPMVPPEKQKIGFFGHIANGCRWVKNKWKGFGEKHPFLASFISGTAGAVAGVGGTILYGRWKGSHGATPTDIGMTEEPAEPVETTFIDSETTEEPMETE